MTSSEFGSGVQNSFHSKIIITLISFLFLFLSNNYTDLVNESNFSSELTNVIGSEKINYSQRKQVSNLFFFLLLLFIIIIIIIIIFNLREALP